MADTLMLANITPDQYAVAEASLIDMVRSAYPALDLRRGTAIRELQIRPDAAVLALTEQRMERLRLVTGLGTMVAAGADDTEIDAVLANFNVVRRAGTAASGVVQVRVDSARTYVLAAGFTFTAMNALQYRVSVDTTARPDAAAGETQLVQAADGSYYFNVAVVAVAAGSASNIAAGTALTADTYLYGFLTASAYSNFSGGGDGETVAEAIARIPVSLSHRGLTSRLAIEAQFRQVFDTTASPIHAVSVQGYGDPAQLRDKHNVFGTATGSRVDVYVRTFVDPVVTVFNKTGVRDALGNYTFVIGPGDAAGFALIKSVSEPDSLTLGTYAFTESRSAPGIGASHHDILESEAANTVYQTATVTVSGVPDAAATHVFKVEAYVEPALTALQTVADDRDSGSVNGDIIVRTPYICNVGVVANVYVGVGQRLDVPALKSAIAAYINTRSFVQRLTRSELARVLLDRGVGRVDLGPNGMQLTGVLRDAAGTVHELKGDALDLGAIANPAAMLVPETCVFTAETSNIHLNGLIE